MREELFKIIKTRIDKLCDETTQHVLEKLKEGELQHKDLNFYLHNGVSDYLNEAIDELDISIDIVCAIMSETQKRLLP